MKKAYRIAAFLIVSALFFGAFASVVLAKDLEPCYHCNKTGEYHCKECGNTGIVVCDGCHGEGKSKCEGEAGKGCDNGYYTCPSCGGDGLSRPIPADGNAGPCGNCGGSGKLRCVVCHTVPGWNICTRCDGKGEVECRIGDCKAAKAVGWKCHYCMGAGYLLTNFWPGENDGVQNMPKKGDKIWVNGKSTTYGVDDGGSGSSGGGSSSGTGKTDTASSEGGEPDDGQPSDGEKTSVDLGVGTWNVGGRAVVAWMNGMTVSGTVTVGDNDAIYLEDLDGGAMRVRVYAEDGFSAVLTPNAANEVCIGRHEPADCVIPPSVGLVVESSGEGGEPVPRGGDVELQTGSEYAAAAVRPDMMSEEQRGFYDRLTEAERAEILENVRNIVMTAQPGRADGDTGKLLEDLAAINGFESVGDGRLFPIYFEGHQEIGFPVEVTVTIERGMLDGGSDIYVYHIKADGELEALGKANYGTYEDGSVSSISFFTDGFSTFFTAAKEIDTDTSHKIDPTGEVPESADPPVVPILIVCAAVIAVCVIVFVIVKKKKKNG